MLMRCFSSSAGIWDAFAVLNPRMLASDLTRPEALMAPCPLVSLAPMLEKVQSTGGG